MVVHRISFHFMSHHTPAVLRPFFRDHPGEPVPEENFWTLWCNGRLTEADTQTSVHCQWEENPFPPIGDAEYRQYAGGGLSHEHGQHT